MDIIIKPFSSEHQQGVLDVILPIQQAEFEIPITAADQPDLQQIPTFYQSGKGNFWVALDVDHVVGTIGLLDIGEGAVALRKMFVHADYRGREIGAAKQLLDTLLTWSRKQGLKAVYLGTTAKFLAAHRFYEKNGFTEILVTDLPAAFPVMKVDTKFYKYTLT